MTDKSLLESLLDDVQVSAWHILYYGKADWQVLPMNKLTGQSAGE